ncbi:trigger factor [Marinilabiliaceae bacterium JC017]|nr:trigger factor [Marinilabiliaceae bacterium JC017]
MNISKENIDALNAVIKLTVNKEDYEQRVSDILKDYRKKVNMPGFRPGKVPAGLVKKMYGKGVLVEEVNKLISENISKFITDNELDLLGEPMPSENQEVIDFDTQDSFEFSFDVAVAPEVEIKLTKREKIPFYNIEITDEMMDQQTKSITSRFGKSETVDAVTETSLVKGDFVQLDEAGSVLEEGIAAEDAVLSMTVVKTEDDRKKLLDAKNGDVIVFDPKVAFPSETEVSYLLKITKEQAAELCGNFQFTIKEIIEFNHPELNQELFDQAFGEGVVSSEEEFKNKVRENIQDTLNQESEYRFNLDARAKLMKKVDVEFPEAFLKRWLLATNKDNEKMTAEQLEKDMPHFLEDLKWQLIKNNLIKAHDLKIEDNDMLEYAKKSARLQFMQYGLSNVPDEHVNNYAVEMLKNEEQRRNFAEGAINEKVMAFIKEAVKLDEKEVSREEFNKLFEKK